MRISDTKTFIKCKSLQKTIATSSKLFLNIPPPLHLPKYNAIVKKHWVDFIDLKINGLLLGLTSPSHFADLDCNKPSDG